MISLRSGHRLGVPVLDTWSFDTSHMAINRIKAVDAPYLHNHPWEWCWALILNGGYTHEYGLLQPDGTMSERAKRTFRPGDINFMPHNLFHRIDAVEPDTYTQIFFGPDATATYGARVMYWTPEGLKAQKAMQDYLAALAPQASQ